MKPPSSNNPNISYLWPTPILSKQFDQHLPVNEALLKLFYQHREKHQKVKSAKYASKDNLYVLYKDNPAIQQLVQFIMDGVYEIASAVNGPYWGSNKSIDIQITGVWFQMSNNHTFHETHVHGNCSWSGVYYVQAADSIRSPDEQSEDTPNGLTRFYGPHLDITAGGHGDFGNLYLQDTHYDSYPEDGKLVVFPPHIKHMPFPYSGEKDRVIVSFHAQVHTPDGFSYGYSFE